MLSKNILKKVQVGTNFFMWQSRSNLFLHIVEILRGAIAIYTKFSVNKFQICYESLDKTINPSSYWVSDKWIHFNHVLDTML